MFVCALETDRVPTLSSCMSKCSIFCLPLNSLSLRLIFSFPSYFSLIAFLSWSILHQILSLSFNVFFKKTNLIYFRFSHHIFSKLLFSIPTSPHSLPQPVSLLYPLSLFQLQSHLWKRSKWESWQNLFQSEAVSSCSLQYGCLVTRTLHLYLFLPSASTTHLNNWIIIEAQDALNERVVLLMATNFTA